MRFVFVPLHGHAFRLATRSRLVLSDGGAMAVGWEVQVTNSV